MHAAASLPTTGGLTGIADEGTCGINTNTVIRIYERENMLVDSVPMENLFSSLPIEYQLLYGTACGYLDSSNLVHEAVLDSIGGVYGAFPQEELLRDIWINPSPITIDCLDPFLISLNSR
jgi:hypothetical protein